MTDHTIEAIDFNCEIIDEFRTNEGRAGGWERGRLMLIHHIGARSGVERVTPVGCFPQGDGRYVVVASNGGSRHHPSWFHNLMANPRINVEVATETFAALAEKLDGAARAELWPKLVAEAPQLGQYETWVSRKIPVLVLTRQD